MSNKTFWDLVKPFLSNKGGMTANEISLVNGHRIVTDDLELCEVFNDYYINIVENISGKKPCKIDEANAIDDDREIVRLVLDKYKNHPSIVAIVQNTERTFQTFSFNEVSTKDVWLQLKILDGRKSTGVDQIPPKIFCLASDELASRLTRAINCSIRNSVFPQNAKTAAVCPLNLFVLSRKIIVQSVYSTHFQRFLKKFSRNNLLHS